jgi:hypothetical protein
LKTESQKLTESWETGLEKFKKWELNI